MRSYDFFANVNLFFSNIPTHIPTLKPSIEGLSSTYYANKSFDCKKNVELILGQVIISMKKNFPCKELNVFLEHVQR